MKQFKDLKSSDIFSHWINISYLPRWGVFLLDLLIVLGAFVVSIGIGNNFLGYNFPQLLVPIHIQTLILLLSQGLFFWAFRTYSGILRYSTFVDTIKVILAVAANGLVLIIINLVYHFLSSQTITSSESISQPFLTTSLIIYIFVAICFLSIWRIIIKTTFEYISHHNKNVKKVLI